MMSACAQATTRVKGAVVPSQVRHLVVRVQENTIGMGNTSLDQAYANVSWDEPLVRGGGIERYVVRWLHGATIGTTIAPVASEAGSSTTIGLSGVVVRGLSYVISVVAVSKDGRSSRAVEYRFVAP